MKIAEEKARQYLVKLKVYLNQDSTWTNRNDPEKFQDLNFEYEASS